MAGYGERGAGEDGTLRAASDSAEALAAADADGFCRLAEGAAAGCPAAFPHCMQAVRQAKLRNVQLGHAQSPSRAGGLTGPTALASEAGAGRRCGSAGVLAAAAGRGESGGRTGGGTGAGGALGGLVCPGMDSEVLHERQETAVGKLLV